MRCCTKVRAACGGNDTDCVRRGGDMDDIGDFERECGEWARPLGVPPDERECVNARESDVGGGREERSWNLRNWLSRVGSLSGEGSKVHRRHAYAALGGSAYDTCLCVYPGDLEIAGT